MSCGDACDCLDSKNACHQGEYKKDYFTSCGPNAGDAPPEQKPDVPQPTSNWLEPFAGFRVPPKQCVFWIHLRLRSVGDEVTSHKIYFWWLSFIR